MYRAITKFSLAETEGIFFLNHEGTFGNKEAMRLYADWLSMPALRWFPTSNGF